MTKDRRSQEKMSKQNKNFSKGSYKSPKKPYPPRNTEDKSKDVRKTNLPQKTVNKKPTPQNQTPKIRITLYGNHAVEAAIKNPARVINQIYVTEQAEDFAYEIIKEANKDGLDRRAPVLLEKQTFDRCLPRDAVHQGIGVDCEPLDDVYLSEIINAAEHKEKSVILLLDQVTDPHNLGAVIRSACAFGADAIIVQSRNAPELNALVAKTASGAVEHMHVVYETNLARTIENLQEHGYFALALDERGEKTIGEAPKYQKTVLILGAEGPGIRPLVRDKCDMLVKLPTAGQFSSLNVSNAAAVSLYAVFS